jgi:geranylgeranyl pyrophosphate synthase
LQVVDDVIDYTVTSQTAGKPTHADLKLGLATAPTIFAAEEFPELNELMDRKFSEPGDVERAIRLVESSQGLRRAKELAMHHTRLAKEALSLLPSSDAKNALLNITELVIHREK